MWRRFQDNELKHFPVFLDSAVLLKEATRFVKKKALRKAIVVPCDEEARRIFKSSFSFKPF